MARNQRPSSVVHKRKSSVDDAHPPDTYKNAAPAVLYSYTRRPHNHRVCRNQTAVAASSLAMVNCGAAFGIHGGHSTLRSFLGVIHRSCSNVMSSSPMCVSMAPKESSLNGRRYSAAARTMARLCVCVCVYVQIYGRVSDHVSIVRSRIWAMAEGPVRKRPPFPGRAVDGWGGPGAHCMAYVPNTARESAKPAGQRFLAR